MEKEEKIKSSNHKCKEEKIPEKTYEQKDFELKSETTSVPEEKDWAKEFDELFYKNENRVWMSRAGESYGSNVPEMGRAELLRFISELLKEKENEIIDEYSGLVSDEKVYKAAYEKGFMEGKMDALNTQVTIGENEIRQETIQKIREWVEEKKVNEPGLTIHWHDAYLNNALRELNSFLDTLK